MKPQQNVDSVTGSTDCPYFVGLVTDEWAGSSEKWPTISPIRPYVTKYLFRMDQKSMRTGTKQRGNNSEPAYGKIWRNRRNHSRPRRVSRMRRQRPPSASQQGLGERLGRDRSRHAADAEAAAAPPSLPADVHAPGMDGLSPSARSMLERSRGRRTLHGYEGHMKRFALWLQRHEQAGFRNAVTAAPGEPASGEDIITKQVTTAMFLEYLHSLRVRAGDKAVRAGTMGSYRSALM